MATLPATDARPGELHQATQAGVVELVSAAVAHIFATLLNPRDLKGSKPRVVAAIQALVTHYGRAASAAALAHYRNERVAAGVLGRPNLVMPPAPSPEDVSAAVGRALSPLYGPTTAEALHTAESVLASETEHLILEQSRSAIIDSVAGDRSARAWARVTEPDACSFCRLLATRGAVYRTEESGNFRAHHKHPDGAGGTCKCHAEPVFGPYEMTAQARQDLADYQRLADEFGHSGRAIHVAWRQHVEGRPVTGPLTKPYTRNN